MAESVSHPMNQIFAEELVKQLIDAAQGETYVLADIAIVGQVDLRHHVVARPIEIRCCHFLDNVTLQYTEFKHSVDFSGCTFHKTLDSGDSEKSHTIYHEDLVATNATFLAGVSFAGTQFIGSVNLVGCRFQAADQDVDFRACQFGRFLILRQAAFLGGARFDGIECKASAYFEETRFDNSSKLIDFSSASFDKSIEFAGATFKGGASFNSISCGGSGTFTKVRFENSEQSIDFRHASFDLVLDCSDSQFGGEADFNATSGIGAFFHKTQFLGGNKTVNMGYLDFKKNLQYRDAIFKGPVSFNSIDIGESLILEGARFEGQVNLRNAKVRHLEVKASHFVPRSLDVRGLTFETIDDADGQGRCFLTEQSPQAFSRDPYIQLENYYKKIGNEAEASEVYYRGRCALRESSRRKGNNIVWSRGRSFFDFVLKWLTGYGVKTERVLYPILLLLSLGVWVFSGRDSLVPKDAAHPPALPKSQEELLVQRTLYSLDLFLPVDLGVSEDWKPSTEGREIYAIVLVISGWLLVPLALASISGLVRKQ